MHMQLHFILLILFCLVPDDFSCEVEIWGLLPSKIVIRWLAIVRLQQLQLEGEWKKNWCLHIQVSRELKRLA